MSEYGYMFLTSIINQFADIKLDIKTPDKKKINVDDISEVTAGEYETKVNFTEEGDYT